MLNDSSPYFGKCVVMTTKHAKSIAVAPGFHEILGAAVVEYPLDTDALGTFSGEVERQGSALDCARRKCEWGLDLLNAKFGIASEGSFGPHPFIPFIPSGLEILHFIDRTRDFHLHVSRLCEKTNYRMQTIDSFERLQKFAEETQFPSHALIVRPNLGKSGGVIFKGIDTPEELERSFQRSRTQSSDGLVWVETDMRAHVNPTRMSEISELARQLAHRLATHCPACRAPGWGLVKAEKGLRCEYCDQPTEMIEHEVFGCVLCDHTERKQRPDGLEKAPQMHCGWCNP
jgi:hypothetical protein